MEEQDVSNKLDKAVLDKNTHIDHQGFTPAALKVQRRSAGGGLCVKPNFTACISVHAELIQDCVYDALITVILGCTGCLLCWFSSVQTLKRKYHLSISRSFNVSK